MVEQFTIDTVVIGAGVVGLACARALAQAGHETLILERNADYGQETSARNSEVIHAGIYYRSDTLKAKLCVEGKHKLYAYCESRGIAHQRCGKLIVAQNDTEADALENFRNRAIDNGVDDLHFVTKDFDKSGELRYQHGLLSPSTGIIDSHSLMRSLLGEAEDAGGTLATISQVKSIHAQENSYQIIVEAGSPITINAKHVINASGHNAYGLAKPWLQGPETEALKPVFAKGSYFRSNVAPPFTQLIYPAPVTGGLGIHSTLDLAGNVRFGPDVEFLLDQHTNFDYAVDIRRSERFYAAIRQYWPKLPDNALLADYAGIRPKISKQGKLLNDFIFYQHPDSSGLIHLLGIESPGLTSCLAIADNVVCMIRHQT